VDRFQYLMLMGLCLMVTLPLEFVLDARVYRRPRRLALTMGPAFAAFVAWDMVAIRLGHWTFSPTFTTGWTIGNIPVEELSFFLVIPLCALLSFEAVVALAVLLVIKVVAEQNLLPDGDIFRAVLAGLLGFLLVESCARVFTLMGYYRRDEAALAAS